MKEERIMDVYWNKCQGNNWCDLLTLNLSHEHFNNMEGVYIIWHGGQNSATIRVGQGFIRDRLSVHRTEPEILKYKPYGLFVTWVRVSANQRDGVERYLAERLNPKVGSRFPDADPIVVNLPW